MSARSVLVVAAHSDDEALGCGATIASHIAKGDRVEVLFMTDGVSARGKDELLRRKRYDAARRALTRLGVENFRNLDFPDNRMDTVPLIEVAQAVEKVVEEVLPQIVYTHYNGDLNIDHQITHRGVMTALRPQPESCVKTILAFEVMSSTEWQTPSPATAFSPDWHVDITETLPTKMKALECYCDEMRAWPHSRSLQAIEHLARHRGACIGVEAAEAFKLIRAVR